MRQYLLGKLLIPTWLFLLLSASLVACRQGTAVTSTVEENGTLVSTPEVDINFAVEEDGSIVSALASTTFGVTDDCVIGLILVGPKNDDGWSEAHFEAANRVSAELGCKLVTFENLNVSASPETTLLDVATMMVDQGIDMIIPSGDAFEEDSNVVAERFPNVPVLQISGSNRLRGDAPENLANSHSMGEASRFIAGCASVRKAYSIKGDNENILIGYIGPLINAETRRQASSAYIGARYCANKLGLNSDTQLTFEVVWIGFWFNIPGVTLDPTEVSNEFFDRGAQVVISAIDTTEAIQVASSRQNQDENVWAIGTDSIDACNVGENACIGEQFYDWTGIYRDQISALLNRNWTARWELRAPNWEQFTNTEAGATTVGFDIDHLTEAERLFVLQVIDDLAVDFRENPGILPGWRGPLNLQDGTLLALEGDVVNPFDVWFLPQLIEGVVGASTSK